MARILIVEDEEKIARFVTLELEHEGYQVEHAADGRTAVDLALERDYDLILLDVLLPQLNGMEVLRRVRKHKDVPVIMVTARDAVMDKVAGLDAGADDYLTKPFDARELLARVRAVLRRVDERRPVIQERARPLIDFADWHLDVTRRELRSPDNVMIPLSAGEFDLLLVFIEHPQRILTREQLLDLARGHCHDAFDRSIDVQVSRLRRKLESDTKRPAMIRTVRNGGYLFTPSVTRR